MLFGLGKKKPGNTEQSADSVLAKMQSITPPPSAPAEAANTNTADGAAKEPAKKQAKLKTRIERVNKGIDAARAAFEEARKGDFIVEYGPTRRTVLQRLVNARNLALEFPTHEGALNTHNTAIKLAKEHIKAEQDLRNGAMGKDTEANRPHMHRRNQLIQLSNGIDFEKRARDVGLEVQKLTKFDRDFASLKTQVFQQSKIEALKLAPEERTAQNVGPIVKRVTGELAQKLFTQKNPFRVGPEAENVRDRMVEKIQKELAKKNKPKTEKPAVAPVEAKTDAKPAEAKAEETKTEAKAKPKQRKKYAKAVVKEVTGQIDKAVTGLKEVKTAGDVAAFAQPLDTALYAVKRARNALKDKKGNAQLDGLHNRALNTALGVLNAEHQAINAALKTDDQIDGQKAELNQRKEEVLRLKEGLQGEKKLKGLEKQQSQLEGGKSGFGQFRSRVFQEALARAKKLEPEQQTAEAIGELIDKAAAGQLKGLFATRSGTQKEQPKTVQGRFTAKIVDQITAANDKGQEAQAAVSTR